MTSTQASPGFKDNSKWAGTLFTTIVSLSGVMALTSLVIMIVLFACVTPPPKTSLVKKREATRLKVPSESAGILYPSIRTQSTPIVCPDASHLKPFPPTIGTDEGTIPSNVDDQPAEGYITEVPTLEEGASKRGEGGSASASARKGGEEMLTSARKGATASIRKQGTEGLSSAGKKGGGEEAAPPSVTKGGEQAPPVKKRAGGQPGEPVEEMIMTPGERPYVAGRPRPQDKLLYDDRTKK
jgi:hypothetical protein